MTQSLAPNTASRDTTTIILGAMAGAVGIFVAITFPAINLLLSHVGFPHFEVINLYLALVRNPRPIWHTIITGGPGGYDLGLHLFFAAIIAAYVSYRFARSALRVRKTEIIEAGEAVEHDTNKAEKRAGRATAKADGVHVHPEIRIPRSREAEHILVAGTTGAGKSQAMTWMIDDIIARGDKALLYDVKGDYTAQLISPDKQERKVSRNFLLAPWDKRSMCWDIAADIAHDDDARAFAEAFVPDAGSNQAPYWTTAPRDVLTGVIIYFHVRCGKNWGWKDLADLLGGHPIRIRQALDSIGHAGAQHIEIKQGAVTPQTQGVMGNLRAATMALDAIAEYWDKPGGTPIVSGFASDKTKGMRIVLASRPDRAAIADPLVAAFLAMAIRRGLSLPKSSSRRIWFIIDELGSLPKIATLSDLATKGRSNGLCLAAGIQDLGMIEHIYGQAISATIANQINTHILGRLNDQRTADWAAKLYGQQRVERHQVSESQQGATTGGISPKPSVSTTWLNSDRAALVDSHFLHLPKATPDGFFMFARMTGDDGAPLLCKLHYPINPVPEPYPAIIDRPRKSRYAAAAGGATASTPPPLPSGQGVGESATAEGATPPQPQAMDNSAALAMLEEVQALRSNNTDEVEHEDESLDAIYDTQPDAEEQQAEQDEEQEQEAEQEGSLDWAVEQKAEDVALHMVGLDGIGPALDIAEALFEDAQGTKQPGGGQQQVSGKRKRRRSLDYDEGMEL